MSKLSKSVYIGTTESVIRRNKMREYFYKEESVIHIVGDMNNVNFRKSIWSCRNYRNHMRKRCNYFKWLDDDVVDERDLKIERQKKKLYKLKNKISQTIGLLKVSIVVGILSLMLNVVFVTMYF